MQMTYSFRNCSITVESENDNGEMHFYLKSKEGEIEFTLKTFVDTGCIREIRLLSKLFERRLLSTYL